MSLNFEEINILGNIINDTYGKSSTGYGAAEREYTHQGPGTQSSVVTKSSLQGEVLTVTSLAIINLGPIGTQHHEITKCENELNQHVNKYI
mgnify:CR=1 FL=1